MLELKTDQEFEDALGPLRLKCKLHSVVELTKADRTHLLIHLPVMILSIFMFSVYLVLVPVDLIIAPILKMNPPFMNNLEDWRFWAFAIPWFFIFWSSVIYFFYKRYTSNCLDLYQDGIRYRANAIRFDEIENIRLGYIDNFMKRWFPTLYKPRRHLIQEIESTSGTIYLKDGKYVKLLQIRKMFDQDDVNVFLRTLIEEIDVES